MLLNRKLERIKSPHAWRNPITFNPKISGINAFQSHMNGRAQRALNATARATTPTNITKQLTIVFFIVVIEYHQLYKMSSPIKNRFGHPIDLLNQ